MTQVPLIPSGKEEWPPVVLESIYKEYPRKIRARALEHIAKSLDRILAGEIDGSPRTRIEAVDYLRSRVCDARVQMGGRLPKHIPHPATYFGQSRYLRAQATITAELENLDDCKSILQAYPRISLTDANLDAHMAVLRVIDSHISYLKPSLGSAAASHIRVRVARFAECVFRWPEEDLQFVPGPLKFFSERRYEQDERHWHRTEKQGFGAERDQIRRVVGGVGRT